jgi:hypothetical protein
MKNFALIVNVQTPVIVSPGSWLTLDSLLSAALQQGENDWKKIPLSCASGVFAGSAAFPIEPRYQDVRFLSSMQHHYGDYDGDKRNKILRAGGPDKPDVDAYPAIETHRIIWFGRGDAQACAALIKTLPGIGKKAAHGFGAIERVETISLKVDRSWVLPDGRPARPMPMALWDALHQNAPDGLSTSTELPTEMTGYRPNYWEDENKGLCVVPQTRALSTAQYRGIESGVAPPSVPDIELSQEALPLSGAQFFARHLGHQLVSLEGIPGNTNKMASQCAACGSTEGLQRAGSGYTTLCQDCFTFGGTYTSIKRPGRLGAGWMGVITPDHSRLATSVDYPADQVPFQQGENITVETGKAAIATFVQDVLMNPPKPPFLLFTSGNSSVNVIRGLRVTWSLRRVHISGNDPMVVDVVQLKEHLRHWRKNGISAANLNKAVRLRDNAKYAYDATHRDQAEAELEKLLKKQDVGDLLAQLPGGHTDDWAYLLRLMNLEEKANRIKAKKR